MTLNSQPSLTKCYESVELCCVHIDTDAAAQRNNVGLKERENSKAC